MELKDMSCPNCGANLKFNSKSHYYECEYCNSTYKDTKANSAGDPRIELNPEDLEMLKPQPQPQATGLLNKHDSHAAIAISIVIAIVAISIVVGFISFFNDVFDMTHDMMDDMDDWETDFDDDWPPTTPSFPSSPSSPSFPSNPSFPSIP